MARILREKETFSYTFKVKPRRAPRCRESLCHWVDVEHPRHCMARVEQLSGTRVFHCVRPPDHDEADHAYGCPAEVCPKCDRASPDFHHGEMIREIVKIRPLRIVPFICAFCAGLALWDRDREALRPMTARELARIPANVKERIALVFSRRLFEAIKRNPLKGLGGSSTPARGAN